MKIVGFGDLLVRLAAPGHSRFIQSSTFEVFYTGAEANVLAFLAWNGEKTSFVTKLPDNLIADCAIANLRQFGIGTDQIVRGGDRIGTYYLERGASQRPSRVIYDRKHTSIATAKRTDFDWDQIFEGATHFHFTGITPALGNDLPLICLDACKKANEKGIVVSCDLNYRKFLWTPEEAQLVMKDLMKYVDVLIGNEEDAQLVLGVKPRNSDVTKGIIDEDAYGSMANELAELYGLKYVAFTLRKSISASDNNWSGVLYSDGQLYYSKEYPIHIVDRVGAGDSFSSGIIYSLVHNYSPQRMIDFAVAASCLKHTIEKDFNVSYIEEVNAVIDGNVSGRIQR